MADRYGNVFGAILGQSACPVFLSTISFTTSASVNPVWPVTVDPGPSGSVIPLSGLQGGVGAASQNGSSLLILQPTADCYVRLVGQGTTAASQTVTYSGSAGAQTITIAARQVSFTAGANDTATAAAAVVALGNDPIARAFVIASNAAGVVTLTSRIKGVGNTYALSVTGTGATANGANLSGGAGPTAGTAAANAFLIPANQAFYVYEFPWHFYLDVKGSTASGTMNVFAGI